MLSGNNNFVRAMYKLYLSENARDNEMSWIKGCIFLKKYETVHNKKDLNFWKKYTEYYNEINFTKYENGTDYPGGI